MCEREEKLKRLPSMKVDVILILWFGAQGLEASGGNILATALVGQHQVIGKDSESIYQCL